MSWGTILLRLGGAWLIMLLYIVVIAFGVPLLGWLLRIRELGEEAQAERETRSDYTRGGPRQGTD